MAKTRIQLQPGTETVAASQQVQSPEFAARVGSAKSGLAFLNCYKNVPGTAFTVAIDQATGPNQPGGSPGGGTISTWVQIGTLTTGAIGANGTVGVTLALPALADTIRWRITTHPAGSVAWDLVVYTYDT